VAADEGVMPQTREHVAILDLLQVPRGVIALTKSDLVQDAEWLELVMDQVRDEVHGTVLEHAAIIPVSARKGTGLPDLLAELDRLVASAPPRPDLGRPRLWIDRVFSVAGFGTVVTGTLIDGRFELGEEVEIVPGGQRARIRGLQLHKTQVEHVDPGVRLAINLSGVNKSDLSRGQVVARPGVLSPTLLVDVNLRVLSGMAYPLEHDMLVELYVGSAHTQAHVRLLDAPQLSPGQQGWVQLRLAEPIAVLRGDRFILRSPSPSLTVGGGQIVQPQPGHRYKRFRSETIEQLEALSRGTPDEILLQALAGASVLRVSDLLRQASLPAEESMQALEKLVSAGDVLVLDGQPGEGNQAVSRTAAIVARTRWEVLLGEVSEILATYHEHYPLRLGMPREELKSRLRLDGTLFLRLVERAVQTGRLDASEAEVHLPEHRVALSAEQARRVEQALGQMSANPFSPPALVELQEMLGSDLMQYLLDAGRLLKVSDSVVFDPRAYAEMEERVSAYLRQNGQITVANVRDLLSTSRKYALGLLEDLDRRRITKRLGDVRVLR
jgi:selenocysteine-specific elongation factor